MRTAVIIDIERQARRWKPALCSLFVLLGFACVSAHASLLIPIPMPQDDSSVKYSLWKDPAVAPTLEKDRMRDFDFEEEVRGCGEAELNRMFGPPVALEDCYVLPFVEHAAVGFSGLGYQGNERSYFLPVGNIGGLLVFPLGGRDYVSAVAFYLKTDGDFRPLRKMGDLKARRAWDDKKLGELKAAILEKINSEKISRTQLPGFKATLDPEASGFKSVPKVNTLGN
jgi:hypothetical protein